MKYKNNLLKRRTEINKPPALILKESGISKTAYYSYENGTHIPNIIKAIKLADALDATVYDLWSVRK